MAQARLKDTVKVHYTGRLDDGTVFDSSEDRDPLEFTLGEGRVISGFENAVLGMVTGEVKTVTIPAVDAYGEYEDGLTHVVRHDAFPSDLRPRLGQRLQVHTHNRQPMVVTVTAISEEGVTLDANHPLAGKNLTFDIKLVSIQ